MLTHPRNRKIVAAASFGIMQRMVQFACILLQMPILLRVLGVAHLGIWGAATSLAWLSGLVDIGVGSALVTLVARSMAHNDIREARSHIVGALTIGSTLALLLLMVPLIACLAGVAHGSAIPYLIAITGLALNTPLSTANNIWMGLQKGYVSSFWELTQTLLTTTGLIAATAFTNDVWVYVAVVYAGMVLSNLGSLVHLFLLHPELCPRGVSLSLAAMKEVGASGIMFFLWSITGGLTYMLDNILALHLLGPEASACMTIALRICITAASLLVVVSQPLWPAFTEAAHKSDRRWIRHALLRGSALIVGVAVAGSSILLLFGERLLHLWLHTNLGIDKALLWAISAWILAHAMVRVPSLLLNGLSLIRFQVVVALFATPTAFVLKFALAPHHGVAGILWGTSLTASIIVAPACIWRIYHWADHAAQQEKKLTDYQERAAEIAARSSQI